MGQPIVHVEIIGKDAVRLRQLYRDPFGGKIGQPMAETGSCAMVDGASSGLAGGIGADMGGGARVTRVTVDVQARTSTPRWTGLGPWAARC